MEKKFPLLWRRDVQYSSPSSPSSSSSSSSPSCHSSSSSRVFTSFPSSPSRFLRFLLPVCYAVSTRLGDTMHACAMGSFYRFLWFAWQSRGGVPGVVLPLHQHATQNSLAYRRNRVAFSRLTYTYTYTCIPRTHDRKCRQPCLEVFLHSFADQLFNSRFFTCAFREGERT